MRGSWQIAFWEGGARWGVGVVGADADSEQAAGDLFSAGARGAGEVLGPAVAADCCDENGEDDDCRGRKENGNGGKCDSECHDVTHRSGDVFPKLAHATGITLAFDFLMAMTLGRH